MSGPRQRPSKDAFFMNIAEAVRDGSPDPKTQVGAVIVDSKKRIISTGFNGTPSGFDDNSIDWSNREEVYPNIIHAEVNAILYSNSKFEGSTLYVTTSPCHECLKIVASAGIKTVIFKNKYKDFDLVEKLAKSFNVKLTQFKEIENG